MSEKDSVDPKEIQEFQTGSGSRVFNLPLEVFPGFWANVYLVVSGDFLILIDSGSGYGESNAHLEEGIRAVGERIGKPISLKDLTHVLITHGHIDHFGGLNFVRSQSPAQVGVHELDFRNLTSYEERIAVVTHRLKHYFIEAGIDEEHRDQLMNLYQVNKSLFHSVPVDLTYESAGMQIGPLKILHVPGHCAGHVVMRLDDILFSGDHILLRTTPHMAPEALTLHTGLAHYLASLESLEAWSDGSSMALGGHESPIRDLAGRIRAIRAHHMDRLEKVLKLLSEPKSISDVSSALFGKVNGYDGILAIEEAGAHIEYLYQRGLIGITNFADVEKTGGPVPLFYVRL